MKSHFWFPWHLQIEEEILYYIVLKSECRETFVSCEYRSIQSFRDCKENEAITNFFVDDGIEKKWILEYCNTFCENLYNEISRL